MKPPPRKRTKPHRQLSPEASPSTSPSLRKRTCHWRRAEQKNLLKALKELNKINRGREDIDYEFLGKRVPSRSASEILSVVEYLRDKVISLASVKLSAAKLKEKKDRKPIQMWTHMASAVAGNLEEPISIAFSQMLIVSSTEPCTLSNCDPPQIYRPPNDKDKPVGRTVPFRPMPRLPVKVEHPGPNLVLKTPAMSQANRLQAPSQVIRVQNGKVPPSQQQFSAAAGTSTLSTTTCPSAATSCQPGAAEILVPPAEPPQPVSLTVTPVTGQVTAGSGSAAELQTTRQPSEQRPSTNSTSKSTSPVPHATLSSSAAGQTPVPDAASSSGSSSAAPTPPLSAAAADLHARFGRTSKFATKDSPRTLGVKSVVDFERIYRYLSTIPETNEECRLTPMESAIVLDLLMSLPEELPLLDCNKLHKHLIQVYRFLSTAANSKTAREMFNELKDGLSGRDDFRTNGQQNAAGGVTDSGGKKLQAKTESQSSESDNTSGQSGDADVIGPCPPLNPFMVPVKLLRRK